MQTRWGFYMAVGLFAGVMLLRRSTEGILAAGLLLTGVLIIVAVGFLSCIALTTDSPFALVTEVLGFMLCGWKKVSGRGSVRRGNIGERM
jgi:uncharacterized membrane protein YoaK (UPF0700 family)